MRKRGQLVKNPRSVEALDHLEEIYSIFEKLDLAQHLTIDLGEIRGFDYYTWDFVPGIRPRSRIRSCQRRTVRRIAGGVRRGSSGRRFFFQPRPARTDRNSHVGRSPRRRRTSIDVDNGFEKALQLRQIGQGGEAMLVIALCKGRFLRSVDSTCSNGRGFVFRTIVASSRKLIFESPKTIVFVPCW